MALTRIEELDSYAQAYADHQIALRDAGEDEANKLRAQLAWSDKRNELRDALSAHNDQERQITEAKTRIATEFPNVPETVYAASVTPEAMEESARVFDEALKAQVAAVAPAPAPVGAGVAGGQPPTGAGQAPTTQNDVEQMYRESAQGVLDNLGNAAARRAHVDKLMTVGINGIVGPAMKNAKNDARRSA